MMRGLRILPLLALLAGCTDVTGSYTCPDWIPPSLEIRVVDAATEQVLNAGVTGTWVSGRFAGTLEREPNYPEQDIFVFGPAGRYGVVVQHAGYQPWGRDDIQVATHQCGLRTEQVVARLERAAGAE